MASDEEIIADLRPTARLRVMDLLSEAGVDVSAWRKTKDGSPVKHPAANPRYCYEWAFGAVDEPAIFCMWHSSLRSDANGIHWKGNFRQLAEKLEALSRDHAQASKVRQTFGSQSTRARACDQRMHEASERRAPIRIIVVDGKQKDKDDIGGGHSKVSKRLLDPEDWELRTYDVQSGAFEVRRGAALRSATAWSNEELRATVTAYQSLQESIRNGGQINKAGTYRELARTFGRSAKAFEYRMQNISYILALMGREWIAGLAPAKNVGTDIGSRITAIISQGAPDTEAHAVEEKLETKRLISVTFTKPRGAIDPVRTASVVTTFTRDAQVKAWVLKRARGICECCQRPAPFSDAAGDPYLEVHHVRRLADGGTDTTSNAVAICPNCHRELHYGIDARKKQLTLIKNIADLRPE